MRIFLAGLAKRDPCKIAPVVVACVFGDIDVGLSVVRIGVANVSGFCSV